MADEPRRSVRATKGQHTKIDLLDQPGDMPKKSKKKATKKQAAQEEEVEVIRCVCGAVSTEEDDPEPWIACDSCGVWQHNVCVGIPTYDDEIPDNYLCEQCGPEFHKELLDGVKRGEKPWEDRRRAYEKKQAEEEEASKKKGKKGKAKRTSDPKSELSHANGKAKSPSVPIQETKKEKKETPARTGSTKRKTRDESHESAKEPPSKSRKVSAAHTTPQQMSPPSDLPVKIIDLEVSRQGGAKLVHKGLLAAIPRAIAAGVYAYSMGDSLESKAERLAIQVEDAVYKTHIDKAAHTQQCRSLGFNLKQNQELCNGLLTKSLSPAAIAVMSTDDMASKELKRETAEMKARADKQAVMVTDDGPRMRRTHKGDEVIEEDNFAAANESTMSSSRRRSMMDPNAEMASRSRENSPGDGVELPDNIDDYRSRDDIRGHATPKQPLIIETKPPPMRKPSQPGDFDINKVFSSVQSPTGPTPAHLRRPSGNAPPANGPGFDPEIDKMLQDDDGNESPPYSPAEYDSDPDIIWRGTVNMDSIAKFPAVAKHLAGADLAKTSNHTPWSDFLQKDLKIAGRIDQDKANEYLCSLRYSPPTDVVVVSVTPTGEAAAQGFNEMFDYFHSKNKYGVLTNKGMGNIRDTYLVPIPRSPGPLPDFIINLEGQKIPENREQPMICVALVIRSEWSADQQRLYEGSSADPQSPSIQGHPQRQMSISGPGPQMSPIAPQGSFAAPNNPTTPSPYPQMTPEEAQLRQAQEEQRHRDQKTGEELAAKILGDFIRAPTVAFLMPQAFQMRDLEWQVIREILEGDQRAQTDLQHLSQVLEVRMAQQQQQQQQ